MFPKFPCQCLGPHPRTNDAHVGFCWRPTPARRTALSGPDSLGRRPVRGPHSVTSRAALLPRGTQVSGPPPASQTFALQALIFHASFTQISLTEGPPPTSRPRVPRSLVSPPRTRSPVPLPGPQRSSSGWSGAAALEGASRRPGRRGRSGVRGTAPARAAGRGGRQGRCVGTGVGSGAGAGVGAGAGARVGTGPTLRRSDGLAACRPPGATRR